MNPTPGKNHGANALPRQRLTKAGHVYDSIGGRYIGIRLKVLLLFDQVNA